MYFIWNLVFYNFIEMHSDPSCCQGTNWKHFPTVVDAVMVQIIPTDTHRIHFPPFEIIFYWSHTIKIGLLLGLHHPRQHHLPLKVYRYTVPLRLLSIAVLQPQLPTDMLSKIGLSKCEITWGVGDWRMGDRTMGDSAAGSNVSRETCSYVLCRYLCHSSATVSFTVLGRLLQNVALCRKLSLFLFFGENLMSNHNLKQMQQNDIKLRPNSSKDINVSFFRGKPT